MTPDSLCTLSTDFHQWKSAETTSSTTKTFGETCPDNPGKGGFDRPSIRGTHSPFLSRFVNSSLLHFSHNTRYYRCVKDITFR